MGLLQKAIETYDANADLVGVYSEGHDPLAPIGHTLTRADIEITLNAQGRFISARSVDKDEPKILIPVTEESGGRTSKPAAHPLCDNLEYVSCKNDTKHKLYISALRSWAESEYSHPFLPVVLAYAEGGTVIEDLTESGVLVKDKKGEYNEKLFVIWRVIGIDGEEPSCTKNRDLFSAFIAYYCDQISERESDLCMLEGKPAPMALQHPKGIIPVNGNAKLISANDRSGFTYRGRFTEDRQAATVGYVASQKAHNALRWLASEQGVREFSGNRIFLCWNPQGKEVPRIMRPMRREDAEAVRMPDNYRQQLMSTMLSFRKDHQLSAADQAVIASFDAATTGRLAVTYYNEISLETFLERMVDWDAHCCWYNGKYGIQAPNLLQITDCAFGTVRGGWLETDDKIQRQLLQRLLDCKVSGGVFPVDIVKVLVHRASSPQSYDEAIWRRILHTACAALQKYRYDTKQGGNEMAWELSRKDRSFQYGRLLAVMERAELDYYRKTNESRQTNAIKFMAEYRRRPFFVFERINRHLHQAYLNRIDERSAGRYEKLVGEIFAILRDFPEEELNKPLDDTYLMGYELQRNAFYVKNNSEENTEEE